MAALAILTLLPSLANATSVPEGAATPPAPSSELVPQDLALDAYSDFSVNLLDGEMSERDFNLLNLGILEQQGMVPRGWYGSVKNFEGAVDEPQAQQPDKAPPPKFILRDLYNVCDINGDNIDDIVANSIDLATGRPFVQAFSGARGFSIWIRYGVRYFAPGSIFPGYQPGTQPLPPSPFPPPNNPSGLPAPQHPQNFGPTIDINDDGVCDFLFMSQNAATYGVDPQVILVDTTYAVMNGTYGYLSLWTNVQRSQIVVTHDLLFNGNIFMCVDMSDFPTGLLAFHTPNGAR
ncbi:MAG TPA: hypothetical protein VI818_08460, partial [Candidatus Thermoplasmatota archaeon]|nr:hypothetical protein [Candidatus Thermoplasmatota archaeon]